MRRINLLVVAVAAAGLLALPAGAQAKVIKVHPGDSIQAAVDQAHPGDTVKVAPGTYTEASQPCPSEPANSCAVVVRKDGISIVRQSRNHGTRGNHGNRVVLQAGEDQDLGIAI